MDQKEWNAYLVEKAEIIDEAILKEANRAFFDEQIKVFRRLWNKFQRAFEKGKEKARADPDLRTSDENMLPPKPGMILEDYYVLETHPKRWWREELPFDPDAYLARFYAPSMSGFYPPEQDTQEGEGALALACEAALWAAIHDFALDAPAHNRLCPKSDTWLYSFWQHVEPLIDMDDWNTAPERRNKLDASFRRVKAKWAGKVQSSEQEPEDANQRQTKKPAETGQDAKMTIVAIIISFLVICIIELSVWLVPVTPFSWLKNHPNSYALQPAIVLLVPCIFVGVLKRQYRKWCVGTGVTLVVLILSLLGGRTPS